MNRDIICIRALLLVATIFFASCTDDDNHNPYLVNNWIYSTMKDVYYWTDEIPSDVDRSEPPELFFESLLSDEDRFSVIVPDYDELINSLSGVSSEAGYEFVLVRLGQGDVIGIVAYVKPLSPAASKNLKRGDIIERINGKTITEDNFRSVIGELSSRHVLTYSRHIEGTNDFEPLPDITMEVVQYQENPNYLHKVFDINGNKIGYFVYNFFADGVNIDPEQRDTRYINEMEDIFAYFKSEGINELILDLRYNGGGSISAATHLASLIGSNISKDKLFYENRWNARYQSYIQSLPDGDEILRGRFIDKEANIGNNLSRVFVLTSSRTASASELIINGLMPFMNVVIVGDVTYGKNVGSIPIEDERNNSNNYGLLPITFKIFNSNGKSDYGDGFEPNVEVSEFGWPMYELGDVDEKLLAAAIATIEGTPVSRLRHAEEGIKPLLYSTDRKLRTNTAIIHMSH